MRRTLLLLIAIGCCQILFSQDKIYRKNGQVVNCKIIEIGTETVKYKPSDNPTGPDYTIDKDRIKKIVFESGKEETFTVNIKDPELYSDQLRQAIKINFLSPLMGYTQFNYEKVTKVGQGYELSVGIIGLGKNQLLDYGYSYTTGNLQTTRKSPFGIFAGAGYKFNKLPDFLFNSTRFTHIMQGVYAKPMLYIGHYAENRVLYKGTTNPYELERQNITFGSLTIDFGKQWVFGERFLIDTYWGLGYGFDNKKGDGLYSSDDASNNYVSYRLGGNGSGLGVTFGIQAGWLFSGKKKDK
jgi:hypothetical protein